MKSEKINSQLLGYIAGFALPVISLIVIYFSIYNGQNFFSFFEILWIQGNISRVLSLALLPNLGLFFIFIWTNKLKSAQGVLGVTIALAFIIIILRFVL